MAESPESILREKLKTALRDAKRLFDENLIDENELKDLKAHELFKYKTQQSALTSTPLTSPVAPCSVLADDEEQATPPPLRREGELRRKRRINALSDDERTVFVEPEIYERLTTPPIFRRRPRAKRRIVLKSDELAQLQRDGTVS